jgi:hypothetical protein
MALGKLGTSRDTNEERPFLVKDQDYEAYILNLEGSLGSYIDTKNACLSVHSAAPQLPIT